ncbi:hypothetical protein HPB50_016021 [Hyalomma asiaticum]|uniref:Uncharacterized protein n=1 Tax=Hyalomma asiaticum TaxID=266040 RepID=A0ACB7TCK6_HYAAI|nr:hypothetical protein HPB50_016021 [Hyalomma asiaticum]
MSSPNPRDTAVINPGGTNQPGSSLDNRSSHRAETRKFATSPVSPGSGQQSTGLKIDDLLCRGGLSAVSSRYRRAAESGQQYGNPRKDRRGVCAAGGSMFARTLQRLHDAAGRSLASSMDRLQHQGQYNSAHLYVPCTRSADKCCQLLEHRDAINQVLLGAGLEIREDHKHPGCVRMALSRSTACNDLWWTLDFWHNNSSMILVRDLLVEHRCITALETYSHIPCPLAVQQALRRSPALKTLTVFQLVPD